MEKNHSNQSSLAVSTDDDAAAAEKKSPPIVIKFKMNMTTAAAADTKQFSCRKTLGGHIRSHISSNNNNNNVVVDSTTTPTSDDQKASCSICGKGFRSNKAFYGHLRLHPEREWRGVHPPPPRPPHKNTHSTSSSSSSYVSDEYNHQTIDENIDLLKCVSSWTVKDRRGRKRKKQAEPKREVEVEGVDEYIERICQELTEMKKKILEEKENQPAAAARVVVAEEQKYKYKCIECNRSFSSHQALGGHRSSHNRYKDSNNPPHTALVNAATSTSASASVSASILVTIAKEENNTNTTASTKVEDGGQLIDQRILGFDLNEPAVLNDDELMD